MSASATLAPNKNVSPLIRGARYVALFTGIFYGWTRYNALAKKEKIIQDREDKIREKRAIQAKKVNEAFLKQHMLDIAKELGHTPVHKD